MIDSLGLVPDIRRYRQHQRLDLILPLILQPHITPTPISTRTTKPHSIIHLPFGRVPCRSSQSAANPFIGIQHLCIRYSPTHLLFLDVDIHSPSLVSSSGLCDSATHFTAYGRATYRLLELGRGELQHITLTAGTCGLPLHPASIAATYRYFYLYLFLGLAPALSAI
jgi:hypothetical protein